MAQLSAMKRAPEHADDTKADEALALRKAFSTFTTGVTVVTAETPDGPIGMTANSFSSLSLDPPLVLWSVAKSSSRHEGFVDAEHFCINILAADQSAICKHFAKSGRDFDALNWTAGIEGALLIADALSTFECERYVLHDAGDHTLIVGRVAHFHHRQGEALCFSQGRFGTFSTNA